MTQFAFRVHAVYPDLDGFEGILLIGPIEELGDGLSVGDTLMVPTAEGLAATQCTGFPLVCFIGDRERTDWVRVTFAGVSPEAVLKGELAVSG
jgi:hypothetical protein